MVELARRGVVLGDARPRLRDQTLLQRSEALEHRLGVGLLGAQVLHDLVTLALGMIVPQPVVLVGAAPVRALNHGHAFHRDRRERTARGVARDGGLHRARRDEGDQEQAQGQCSAGPGAVVLIARISEVGGHGHG